MYVKICGMRDVRLVAHAIDQGADAIGVVMSPGTPRHATFAEAEAVVQAAKAANPAVDTVLVIAKVAAGVHAAIAADLGFDVLQLHGRYERADFDAARVAMPRLWRAASLEHFPELRVGDMGEERLLLDGAAPGSGERWSLGSRDTSAFGDDWILAGGLSPANVGAAIAETGASGVDVSSGVETAPGVKSADLIGEFIKNSRSLVL